MQPVRLSPDDFEDELIADTQRRPPGERVLDAARLFDRVCMFMEAGIRLQYPDADEGEVRRLLRERLELSRKLEDAA